MSTTNSKKNQNLKSFLLANTSEVSIFILLIILIVVGTLISPFFLNSSNLNGICVKFSYYGIAAAGCMMVMILGGIDISQMCVLGVTVMLCGVMDRAEFCAAAIIGLSLLYGIAAGVINGILVAKLKVMPMIATIGTSFAWRAVAYLVSPTPISIRNDFMDVIGYDKLLGLPVLLWIFIVVILVIGFISAFTPFGRKVHVAGSNASTSYLSGINVVRTKMIAYTISGFTAALAGVIWAAQLSSAYPNAGVGYDLLPIASCVIGGVALEGGKGSLVGVLIGVLVMVVLQNIMTLLSLGQYYQLLCQGVVLILSLALRGAINKRKQRA